MGADEQACSRLAHPAPTFITELHKLQRKGKNEKVNKGNLKKKQSKPWEHRKREAWGQSANLKKLQVRKHSVGVGGCSEYILIINTNSKGGRIQGGCIVVARPF